MRFSRADLWHGHLARAGSGERRSEMHGRDARATKHQMKAININEKLSLINDHWNPHIVGELNGQYLKLVKFQGPFTWHHHDSEDEMFLVVKGRFRMDFREPGTGKEREEFVEEGEFFIVPRGVEHRPVAEEEAHVLLFEPASTLNTGNVDNELTRPKLEWV